ncbi:hypothetical protein CVS40_12747 [Lucilia cuprina]|nr:hypothetical protein CVS40_12747 [Lucilia cuprina]
MWSFDNYIIFYNNLIYIHIYPDLKRQIYTKFHKLEVFLQNPNIYHKRTTCEST